MKYGPKKKICKYLTFEGKEVFLPFISKASPNILHRIEKMQETVVELHELIEEANILDQLLKLHNARRMA